jgi:hypothetical protein
MAAPEIVPLANKEFAHDPGTQMGSVCLTGCGDM